MAAGLVVLSFSAGCGQLIGCRDAVLSLDTDGGDLREGPVTLMATLTSNGNPVEGAGLRFFVRRSGPNVQAGGLLLETVRTEATGMATVQRDDGLQPRMLPDQTLEGWGVSFIAASNGMVGAHAQVDGVHYCETTETRDLP